MAYSGNIPNLPLQDSIPTPVDLTDSFSGKVSPKPFIQPEIGSSSNVEGDNGTSNPSQEDDTVHSPETSQDLHRPQDSDTSDILSLFSSIANSTSLADYVNAFHTIFDNIDESMRFKWDKIDASAKMQLIQNAMDKAYTLAAKQFDIDYTYQMWLMQQEYNSPAAQLARLNEAGLGGMYSSVQSNMAQSAPSSSSGGEGSGSGSSTPIGNLQQAADASKRQARAQWAQVAVSAASTMVGAYTQLSQLPAGIAQMRSAAQLNHAQVARLEQMTPAELDSVHKANDLLDQTIKKEGKLTEGAELQNQYQQKVNQFYQEKVQSDLDLTRANIRDLGIKYDNYGRELGIREEANRMSHEANMVSASNARLSAQVAREGLSNAYNIANLGEEESEVLVDSKTGFTLGADVSAQIMQFASVDANGNYTYGGMTFAKQRQKRVVPSANMKKMNPSATAQLLKDLNLDMKHDYSDRVSKTAGKAAYQALMGKSLTGDGYKPNNFMSYGSIHR